MGSITKEDLETLRFQLFADLKKTSGKTSRNPTMASKQGRKKDAEYF